MGAGQKAAHPESEMKEDQKTSGGEGRVRNKLYFESFQGKMS
jgi:hypothetical protein